MKKKMFLRSGSTRDVVILSVILAVVTLLICIAVWWCMNHRTSSGGVSSGSSVSETEEYDPSDYYDIENAPDLTEEEKQAMTDALNESHDTKPVIVDLSDTKQIDLRVTSLAGTDRFPYDGEWYTVDDTYPVRSMSLSFRQRKDGFFYVFKFERDSDGLFIMKYDKDGAFVCMPLDEHAKEVGADESTVKQWLTGEV